MVENNISYRISILLVWLFLLVSCNEKTDKKEAESFLPRVVSTIDKMVKRNIFHKNKANNLKSKLAKFVNKLKAA